MAEGIDTLHVWVVVAAFQVAHTGLVHGLSSHALRDAVDVLDENRRPQGAAAPRAHSNISRHTGEPDTSQAVVVSRARAPEASLFGF